VSNNVSTTNGVIASDDIAGIQYQRVKLVDGSEDSTTGLPGDAVYGLDVDVTRVSGTVTTQANGAVSTAAPTYIAGTQNVLSLDTAGALRVAITSGAGSGGSSQTDDAPFAVGTSAYTTTGGTYKSALDAVDDGDGGAFAMTAKRAIHATLMTPLADSAMDDTANAVKVLVVDAAGAVITAGAEYTEGETDATISGQALLWEDTSDTLRAVSAVKPLPVNVVAGSSAALGYVEDVASAGAETLYLAGAIRRDSAASSSGTTGDFSTLNTDATGRLWTHAENPTAANLQCEPAGNVAHDGADSGNPVKVGGRAVASPKALTMVAAADRADFITDIDGIQIVKTGTAFGDLISERITDTGGSSTSFSTFSAVGSTRNFITAISIVNTHATTNGYVDIRDGTSGAVLWTMAAPAGGGSVQSFPTPLRQPTANTALAYDVSGAISTIILSVTGFQSKA
jgi:hypothetical protein